MKNIRRFHSLTIIIILAFILTTTITFFSKPLFSSLAATFRPASSQQFALGVAVDGFPDKTSVLDSYINEAGGPPAAAMWYGSFTDPFNAGELDTFADRGIVPLLTKGNPVGMNDAQIANGAIDTQLHAFAHAAAQWGKLMLYRPDQEMNGDWEGFGPGQNGNTDQSFIAMWQHIVTIFRQEGANNVKFIYSPNMNCAGACIDFKQMYPGNNYVDWVALDGYNWGNFHPYSTWDSFTTIFAQSYDEITSLAPGKPFAIGETGSAPNNYGGSKAAWITSAFFNEIPTLFPLTKLVMYFDFYKPPSEPNWMIDGSPDVLQAYRQVVASPMWQGKLTTVPASNPSPVVTPAPTVPLQTSTVAPMPTASATPTAGITVTPTSMPYGTYISNFEDGTIDNWETSEPNVSIHNSTMYAQVGTHSLQVSYQNNSNNGDNGYHHVDIAYGKNIPTPLPGQTLTAYIYVPTGPGSALISAHIYVEDGHHQWHADSVVALKAGTWNLLSYTVPTNVLMPIYHMGIQFIDGGGKNHSGTIYIDSVKWI